MGDIVVYEYNEGMKRCLCEIKERCVYEKDETTKK